MIDHNREFPPDPNRPDPNKLVVIPPLRNLDAPTPKPGFATRVLTRQLRSLLGLWGLELPETIREKIFIFPLTVCFIITELLAVNLTMVDPVSAILGSVLALGISWYGSLRVGMRWFSLVLVPTMVLACLFFSPWGAIWVTASSLGGAFGAKLSLVNLEEDDLMLIPPASILAVFALLLCISTGFSPSSQIDRYGHVIHNMMSIGLEELENSWGVKKNSLEQVTTRELIVSGVGIWCFGCRFAGRLSRQAAARRSAGKSALILFRVQPRYIFLLILALISEISRHFVAWPVIGHIGLSVLVILGMAFFFQGLGLILFFSILQRTVGNLGRSVLILFLGLVSILLSGGWIVVLAGLIDHWFDFRKVLQIRKHLDEQKL